MGACRESTMEEKFSGRSGPALRRGTVPDTVTADQLISEILEPEHRDRQACCRFYTEFRLACIYQGCVVLCE